MKTLCPEYDNIINEVKKRKDFLNKFFKDTRIWYDTEYLANFVIYNKTLDINKGFSIFYNRVLSCIDNFVKTNYMTEEELRKTLIVMVKERVVISKENVKLYHISTTSGVYDYLFNKKIQETQKFEKWLDDEDLWEGL